MTDRRLSDVIDDAPGLRVRRRVGPDPVVAGATANSGAVRPGDVFACIRGVSADGHHFAPAAVAAGAVAVLADHELDLPGDVAQLVVDDVRVAIGPLAAAVHRHPSRALDVVGVTGTNGKTTTTAMIAAIAEHAGRRCRVIGTLTGTRTTPEAPDLQRALASARDSGDQVVAMEVSSHAMTQHRVDGTRFAAAVFTNLTQDHLDFHGTMEAYFAAKAALFTPELTALAVIGVDDPYGRRLAAKTAVEVTPFSLADAADVRVATARCSFRWHRLAIELPVGGRFNVLNALAAATTCEQLGIGGDDIAAGIATLAPVPGRFEAIDAGQDFGVVVDYAHTPDSLAKVLDAARGATQGGRVLVVFGCGGDRDAAKRPLMGQVAGAGADVVLVTSDNPRHEDPAAIIAAVISGIDETRRRAVRVEADRRAAIGQAFALARPGDVVVIAGKGHEPYQEIGDDRLVFDDRDVARSLLAQGGLA